MVRRIALTNGLDELGREQIGQIVRFAALAVRAGEGETLTRTEARAAVADWPGPPRAPANSAFAARRRRVRRRAPVDIGAIWSLRRSRAEIPAGPRAGARRRGRDGPALPCRAGWRRDTDCRRATRPSRSASSSAPRRCGSGSPSARAERGSYRSASAPASGSSESRSRRSARPPRWSRPRRTRSGAQRARLALSIALRVTARLTIGARLAGDFVAADVHYDLRDAGGALIVC